MTIAQEIQAAVEAWIGCAGRRPTICTLNHDAYAELVSYLSNQCSGAELVWLGRRAYGMEIREADGPVRVTLSGVMTMTSIGCTVDAFARAHDAFARAFDPTPSAAASAGDPPLPKRAFKRAFALDGRLS